LSEAFIAGLDDPTQFDGDWNELIASIQRLRLSRLPLKSTPVPLFVPAPGPLAEPELWRSESAVVTLARTADGFLTAVKTAVSSIARQLTELEAAIHRDLNHPLIIAFRQFHPESASIVTEIAGNWALSRHLRPNKGDAGLRGPNRIARNAVGMAFALEYLHSRGIVHRDLRPQKVLLDFDWNVRITGFGRSFSPTVAEIPSPKTDEFPKFLSRDWRDVAPECFENESCLKSEVFSFGMILYEVIVGEPVLPPELGRMHVVAKVFAHRDLER
jgi:serine/threonine protein kinase